MPGEPLPQNPLRDGTCPENQRIDAAMQAEIDGQSWIMVHTRQGLDLARAALAAHAGSKGGE